MPQSEIWYHYFSLHSSCRNHIIREVLYILPHIPCIEEPFCPLGDQASPWPAG